MAYEVAPAGWYPDPQIPSAVRWWDGRAWTSHTQPWVPMPLVQPMGERKSRSVAVVMAIFLSFWSFLYTYSASAWKFWLGLGIVILAWVVAIVLDVLYSGRSPFTALLVILIPLGVWIWSVVDRANTPL